MKIPPKMKFYSAKDIDVIPQLQILDTTERFEMKVVSHVLPFRTNNYVIEELIDWNNIPDDPIYQLTFLQKEMITDAQFNRIANLLKKEAPQAELNKAVSEIRHELNPQPAGQLTANVPYMEDETVPGVQHKYRETCLIFPSSGQTCHAYCTFCFRWAQFVGMTDLKFTTDESKRFQLYLKNNKEISDVLITGGDPMIMSANNLKAYIEPLLEPEFEHIQNIRIGTKSVAYWPYRYISDKDSEEILRLFEKVADSGKHLAIMGHYNHWVELSTEAAQLAVKRIKDTGAIIRTQSPLIKHINDDPSVWARLWKEQIRLGLIPYYFFIERNTGAKNYFEVPLIKAYEIFRDAYKQVSGLARNVRGPSMSALPGKIRIEGVAEVRGEKVFVLTLIQARNPEWCRIPFFAKYDPEATWYTDLKPAFDEDKFFYSEELNEIFEQNYGQMYFGQESNDNIMGDMNEEVLYDI